MAGRPSSALQMTLLKAWHAWLAGGFLVAYMTADEDTYALHQFAGYAVLAAVAVRLAAGVIAPPASPLRLPRPSWRATRAWLATRTGRHPLFAWLAVALLTLVGLTALSGALADGSAAFEDPHEAIGQAALWVIAAHIAFVFYMYAGRKWLARLGEQTTARPKDCT
ncbi:MAG: hypothetical protein ACM3II_03155 [Rhodospirillaceae bacterium]